MGDNTGRVNVDVHTKELHIGREVGSGKWSTGLVSDRRGEEVYHGGVEDGPYDHDTTHEMKLGVASVGWDTLGVQLASTRWIAQRNRWLCKPAEEKLKLYASQKEARANRTQVMKREDSINRKAATFYKDFLAQRDEDYPQWQYADDGEKARLERIDSNSSHDLATSWRLDEDERRLQALVIRYAAFLEDIDKKIVQQRFRRSQKFIDQANFVFSVDAEATGLLMPFDSADELLRDIGDPLALEIATPRTDRERRHWLISNVLPFYESGGAMPPYMTHTIDALLDSVAEILIDHEEQQDEALV
jgi:hypothetical protein